MITNNAREGFDYLLLQGIKSCLANQDSDNCQINIKNDLTESQEPHLAVLTISSYLFRLMVFIHFATDNPTREHFAKLCKTNAHDMNEKVFMDAICERANMCCGSLSRDLSRAFPHIGMSTPNIINRQCALHLHLLNFVHIRHFKVEVNTATHFHVTLCVNSYDDLDFTVDKFASDASTGELEMF